jgi:hypothetical protein
VRDTETERFNEGGEYHCAFNKIPLPDSCTRWIEAFLYCLALTILQSIVVSCPGNEQISYVAPENHLPVTSYSSCSSFARSRPRDSICTLRAAHF